MSDRRFLLARTLRELDEEINGPRVAPNEVSERSAVRALCDLGLIVLRRGWPDVLVIEPRTKRTIGVELKPPDARILEDEFCGCSRHQIEMLRALRIAGLDVQVWQYDDVSELAVEVFELRGL